MSSLTGRRTSERSIAVSFLVARKANAMKSEMVGQNKFSGGVACVPCAKCNKMPVCYVVEPYTRDEHWFEFECPECGRCGGELLDSRAEAATLWNERNK